MQQLTGERSWFLKKRFGMFVHWGVYALGGLHEQEQWRYNVPAEKYEKYAQVFNPEKFDPAQWLDLFQECGMEYLVFTAKHHDGFCMWDTKETDYNIMNTPYGKDILGLLAEECHKRDFPLEIYYSCVDWHHPAYPNLGRHHEIVTDPAKHDFPAYMEFLKNQIRELCTNYGKIHGIWWDMNVPGDQIPEVNELNRSLQSAAVINNRGYGPGDYSTPERESHSDIVPFSNVVEACESINMHSWGFRKDNDLYTNMNLEQKIAVYTALGGNFLLNAGPMADGTFDPKSTRKLKTIGSWYNKVKGALTDKPFYVEFHDAKGMGPKGSAVCTGDGKTLNLICLNTPNGENLRFDGIGVLPESAVLLNSGETLPTTLASPPYSLLLPPALRVHNIPVDDHAGEVMVIQLKFSEQVIQPLAVETVENTSGILTKE